MTETVLAGEGGDASRHEAVSERGLGAVFTRRWIVDLILDLAGYTADRDLASLVALEPSCGHGAFVAAMVDRLVASCRARDLDVDGAGSAIAAFDIDPLAVRATRAVVTRQLVGYGVTRNTATRLAAEWVRQADFLDMPATADSADVVVGNPPYVRLEDVPPDRMDRYREAWPTMTGRADVYVGFYEAALRRLRPDGVLAFICSDRWMRNQYGQRLRELVERSFAVDATVVMHDVDAFDRRVAAYPAVTVLRRGAQREALVVEADGGFGGDDAAQLVRAIRQPGRPLRRLNSATASWSSGWFRNNGSWPIGAPERLALLADLERRFAPLDAEGAARVGIGVASGADDVYVTAEPDVVEPDRLLPLMLPRDTTEGHAAWSGHYLVNPWDDEGELVDLREFPRLRRYLRRHEHVLRGRHVARGRDASWWRTIDKVTPGLAQRPKLLIPDLKSRVHPVLDEGGHYPHHNLFYVTSDVWDLRVLGGLLLSEFGQLFVEAYSVRMANGCLRVTAQYLRRVRVPDPASIRRPTARRLAGAFDARDVEAATAAAAEVYGV